MRCSFVTGADPLSGAVAIRRGRSLRRSPVWDCAPLRVVFDAASGDHWVVTGEADALLLAIEALGTATLVALAASRRCDDPAEEAQRLELLALVDGLVGAGLVVRHDA